MCGELRGGRRGGRRAPSTDDDDDDDDDDDALGAARVCRTAHRVEDGAGLAQVVVDAHEPQRDPQPRGVAHGRRDVREEPRLDLRAPVVRVIEPSPQHRRETTHPSGARVASRAERNRRPPRGASTTGNGNDDDNDDDDDDDDDGSVYWYVVAQSTASFARPARDGEDQKKPQ